MDSSAKRTNTRLNIAGEVEMKIAVIGDVMTDIDIHCEVVKSYGFSPVLRELNSVQRPGGAANVARMCEALNVKTLLLGQKSPIVKRRFLVDGEMLFRHDTELIYDYHFSQEEKITLKEFRPDAVIVADHAKGTVTAATLELIPKAASVFIDPQPTTPTTICSDRVTWVGSSQEIPKSATGRKVIKHGAEGVTLCDITKNKHWKSACQDCVDDIGAGDQFITCLAVARLRGYYWEEAVEMANNAAGEQCRRSGIQPITEF